MLTLPMLVLVECFGLMTMAIKSRAYIWVDRREKQTSKRRKTHTFVHVFIGYTYTVSAISRSYLSFLQGASLYLRSVV